MRTLHFGVTLFVMSVGLLWAGTVGAASIGDPVPASLDGSTPVRHIYSVTGVRESASADLSTLFMCTNTQKTGAGDIVVGVQVFDSDGTRDTGDVTTGSGVGSISPGETRTFSTENTAAFSGTVLGTDDVFQGSARILATSSKIICTAMIVENTNSPPTSMVSLPVFKKLKQKGQ